jgi:hypothetical protein
MQLRFPFSEPVQDIREHEGVPYYLFDQTFADGSTRQERVSWFTDGSGGFGHLHMTEAQSLFSMVSAARARAAKQIYTEINSRRFFFPRRFRNMDYATAWQQAGKDVRGDIEEVLSEHGMVELRGKLLVPGSSEAEARNNMDGFLAEFREYFQDWFRITPEVHVQPRLLEVPRFQADPAYRLA